jgi:hypothetical protein
MKIYYVWMSHYDGDHDSGYYQSPFFAKREDAEAFLAKVTDRVRTEADKQWYWNSWYNDEPIICEAEVIDTWDGTLHTSDHYYTCTYT